MASSNGLCDTDAVERTVTEISANTASVVGRPIVAAVPVAEIGPSRGVRRRLPGGHRILAFCDGDAITLRSSIFSATLTGRVLDRRRVEP